MWIHVPKDHLPKECLVSAPGSEESSLDSQPLNPLQASFLKQYATWNTKSVSEESWQRTFKRENLGMHLSGLTYAPSVLNAGAARWTSSLGGSHVSPIVGQGSNDTETIQENSAEKSSELPESWGNQLSFWKTSQAYPATTGITYDPNYERWAMKLKRDSSLRQRSVLLRRENGSSSWPTPTAMDRPRTPETMAKSAVYRKETHNKNTVPLYLGEVATNWPTPAMRDYKGAVQHTTTIKNGRFIRTGNDGTEYGATLDGAVGNWPTPSALEHKARLQGDTQQSNGLTATSRKHSSSLQDPETRKDGHECSPRCLRLNPVFVECLMGFPLGISNVSEPLGMQSFQQWQLMLMSTLTELLKEK